jgi:hypothetical protein
LIEDLKEVVQEGGKTLHPAIHKLHISIWGKEELPQQ